MTSLLFPGSFDPLTRGHKDIARRASKICDKLYVVVMNNNKKTYLFDLDERVQMVKEVLGEYENIEVLGSDGLLVDIFKDLGCNAVVRGIRSESDFRFDAEMALASRMLCSDYDATLLTGRHDRSVLI